MPDPTSHTAPAPEQNSPRTTRLRSSAYALGDVGFNLYWTTTETFLFFFYTDIYQLPAASLASAVLLARAVDLFVGPAIGFVADRTGSRLGHYRPYLLLFAIPLGASFCAMFSAPATWPHPTHAKPPAAAIVALLLFTLFYAAANIPYTALLAVITPDAAEKRKLSSLRFAAAAAAVLTVQFATLPLVQRFGAGNAATGWQRTALIYALVASAALLCCFAGTREMPVTTAPRIHLRSDLIALGKTGNWYALVAVTIFSLGAFSCRGGVTLYYMRYVLNRPDLTNLFLVANSAAALGACLLASAIPRSSVSPRVLVSWSSIGGVLAALALGSITAEHLTAAFFVQMLFGFSTGALLPAVFALFADLPFDSPSLRGRSINGVIASTSLIALKCGGLCGTAILAICIARIGYVPNHTQTTLARHAIVSLISLVPAALLLLCWFSSLFLREHAEPA
jgi:GPH family glycoside/pentoside/hexuronide:cation symporter